MSERTSRLERFRPRPRDLVGLAGVCLSAALAFLGFRALSGSMRIHWTLGLGPYSGPEFAPTAPLMLGFLATAVLMAGAAVVVSRLLPDEGLEGLTTTGIAWAVLGSLWIVLSLQAGLILANLA